MGGGARRDGAGAGVTVLVTLSYRGKIPVNIDLSFHRRHSSVGSTFKFSILFHIGGTIYGVSKCVRESSGEKKGATNIRG